MERFGRIASAIATLGLIAFLGDLPAAHGQSATAAPPSSERAAQGGELRAALSDPVLDATFGPTPRVPASFQGAVSLNADFERGIRPEPLFYQQRVGGRWVQIGLARNDAALRRAGWQALRWGYELQRPDGAFDDNPGSILGIASLLENASIALLAERQWGIRSEGEALLEPMTRSARHIAEQDPRMHRGLRIYERYVHRYWVTAAALGMVGELTDNEQFRSLAISYARQGFVRQTPEGINPEGGGYDVGYHAAGLISAGRFYVVCRDPAVREMVQTMMLRGGAWLAGQVAQDGSIDPGRSTRVLVEGNRRGGTKRLPALQVAAGLAWSAQVTGRQEFRAAAERILRAEAVSAPRQPTPRRQPPP